MTRKEVLLLISRLEEELNNIAGLEQELREKGYWPAGRAGSKSRAPAFPAGDTFTLRAIGSVLHDFYVAAENLFQAIARELDEKLPEGPTWHHALLRQMTLTIPGVRPAVLRKETAQRLDDFRAFRHVFRNVYGFNLSAEKLRDLLLRLPPTVAALRRDVEQFIAALRANLPEEG
ncbi:MAG: hypothetical protein ACPLPT_04005 [Moorellales bacterium]